MQAIEELEKALAHLGKARDEWNKEVPHKTRYWERWGVGQAIIHTRKVLELLKQEKEE